MERRGEQSRGRIRTWITDARDALAKGEVAAIDEIARSEYGYPEDKIPEKRRIVINRERNKVYGEFLEGFATRKRRRRLKRLERFEARGLDKR